ncbi:hypothetical protein K470DRAFT_222049 [Piedraia hortae CBS 480.64]|uniref:J domain-containing protein n=1 Tax=Piedraia hortae CBS 480.64 TaxID=1314780 RepID=A0A6A7BS92_9PEZI|nr:hypothetical protein K470DRAFT_222049 [Piedraia hortae CBS 480.64]
MADLLSFVGWYFLPGLVTGYVQSALYTIFIRAGDPKPRPGSKRYNEDRKNIHAAVIVAYLAYTLYEASYQLQRTGDFYKSLGVLPSSTEKWIQNRFRRLTIQFHPDKVPPSKRESSKATYIALQAAKEVLVDPAKRFAYDRFGPEVVEWTHCKTIRDFVMQGLQRTVIQYVSSGVVLALLGMLGYLTQGRFWHFFIMAALFVVELYTVTRPANPALMSAMAFTGAHLPFQVLVLFRKVAFTVSAAISQLGSMFRDPSQTHDETVSPQLLDSVDALVRAAQEETSRLLGLELTSLASADGDLLDLRNGMKDWLVENTVRNSPEVKNAVQKVIERRKTEHGDIAHG